MKNSVHFSWYREGHFHISYSQLLALCFSTSLTEEHQVIGSRTEMKARQRRFFKRQVFTIGGANTDGAYFAVSSFEEKQSNFVYTGTCCLSIFRFSQPANHYVFYHFSPSLLAFQLLWQQWILTKFIHSFAIYTIYPSPTSIQRFWPDLYTIWICHGHSFNICSPSRQFYHPSIWTLDRKISAKFSQLILGKIN
jgi:hypothetical protein